jgi:hypothetical protein
LSRFFSVVIVEPPVTLLVGRNVILIMKAKGLPVKPKEQDPGSVNCSGAFFFLCREAESMGWGALPVGGVMRTQLCHSVTLLRSGEQKGSVSVRQRQA